MFLSFIIIMLHIKSTFLRVLPSTTICSRRRYHPADKILFRIRINRWMVIEDITQYWIYCRSHRSCCAIACKRHVWVVYSTSGHFECNTQQTLLRSMCTSTGLCHFHAIVYVPKCGEEPLIRALRLGVYYFYTSDIGLVILENIGSTGHPGNMVVKGKFCLNDCS